MTNDIQRLDETVLEFYKLVKKLYGDPKAPIKKELPYYQIEDKFRAACYLWGILAANGNEMAGADKLGVNRNTTRGWKSYLALPDRIFRPSLNPRYFADIMRMGLVEEKVW